MFSVHKPSFLMPGHMMYRHQTVYLAIHITDAAVVHYGRSSATTHLLL